MCTISTEICFQYCMIFASRDLRKGETDTDKQRDRDPCREKAH